MLFRKENIPMLPVYMYTWIHVYKVYSWAYILKKKQKQNCAWISKLFAPRNSFPWAFWSTLVFTQTHSFTSYPQKQCVRICGMDDILVKIQRLYKAVGNVLDIFLQLLPCLANEPVFWRSVVDSDPLFYFVFCVLLVCSPGDGRKKWFCLSFRPQCQFLVWLAEAFERMKAFLVQFS